MLYNIAPPFPVPWSVDAKPRTIRDWNDLPHNVVQIADDAKFRKLLLFAII